MTPKKCANPWCDRVVDLPDGLDASESCRACRGAWWDGFWTPIGIVLILGIAASIAVWVWK